MSRPKRVRPNARERVLAQELDLAIVEVETEVSDIEQQSIAVQRLIARHLARYRSELRKEFRNA